jgi:hypothetical protein
VKVTEYKSSSRALTVVQPAPLVEVIDCRAIWSTVVELPAERDNSQIRRPEADLPFLRPMLRRLPRIKLPRVELGDVIAVIAACAMLGLPLLAIAAVMNCICR